MTNIQMPRKQTRDITFDVMKGLGILSVIAGHCFGGYIHSFIYTFHIPLFFILSGYFWKQRPIGEDFHRNAIRLLLPVCFTQGVICLLSLLRFDNPPEDIPTFQESLEQLLFCSTGVNNPEVIWGSFSSIGKIWFLAALFWAKSIYNVIATTKLSDSKILILCLFLSLTAIYTSDFINLPWCFLQGLSCIFYVAVGASVKRIGISSLSGGPLKTCSWFIAFLAWLCFVPYNLLDVYYFSWNDIPLVNIVIAVIGTYFVYAVSKLIGCKFAWGAKVLSIVGFYSLVILCILSIKNMFPTPAFISSSELPSLAVILAWKLFVFVAIFICIIRIPIIKRIFKV